MYIVCSSALKASAHSSASSVEMTPSATRSTSGTGFSSAVFAAGGGVVAHPASATAATAQALRASLICDMASHYRTFGLPQDRLLPPGEECCCAEDEEQHCEVHR